ncbi:MAG: glycosyltransferase [Lactobacillus sp.]|nr:glycosyltransferase [Lactobacillus sp.]
MKVLHVNAGLENGGGLTHIITLLTEAQEQGEDFELLVLQEGPVAQAAREHNLKVTVLGAKGRFDLLSLKRLKNFINENNFQIVHTHGARANQYLALIHRQIEIPWCVTVHSDPFLDFAGRGILGKLFTHLNLMALKKADHIFSVTKNFQNLLTTRLNLDNVTPIYNGIVYHQADEIPAKINNDEFNMINVGRMEPVKGQKLLLEALELIPDLPVHLHIVGDGSQMNRLKEYAQAHGLSHRVTFHGFLSQKKITHLYRRMNLALLSSYSESFPLVMLEAADNLVPLLATNVGDMEVMIPDDMHGFVVPIGDVQAIRDKIEQAYLMDKKDLEKMAELEKDYVMRNFSIDRQLNDLLTGYRKLMR